MKWHNVKFSKIFQFSLYRWSMCINWTTPLKPGPWWVPIHVSRGWWREGMQGSCLTPDSQGSYQLEIKPTDSKTWKTQQVRFKEPEGLSLTLIYGEWACPLLTLYHDIQYLLFKFLRKKEPCRALGRGQIPWAGEKFNYDAKDQPRGSTACGKNCLNRRTVKLGRTQQNWTVTKLINYSGAVFVCFILPHFVKMSLRFLAELLVWLCDTVQINEGYHVIEDICSIFSLKICRIPNPQAALGPYVSKMS